jgi:hypothetical protein
MAACNLAMGATLVFSGAGAFSSDNFLLAMRPHLAERRWFRWLCGSSPLPVSSHTFLRLALALLPAPSSSTWGYSYCSRFGSHALSRGADQPEQAPFHAESFTGSG